jgi:thiosulfate reductase cytochrome b subunit
MAVEVAHTVPEPASAAKEGHRAWVRTCHWVGVLSFLALVYSGIFIFAVHPRLYWGEVGNSLTPALLEIPITANHRPDGWQRTATFPLGDGDIFTATRTYSIFNQNGWARSLHFLAAWLLVAAGLVYFVTGIVTGHARKNLLPPFRDLKTGAPLEEARKYLKGDFGVSGGGAPYGSLQRLSYSIVIFFLFPLMIMTGMTMSPAMTATFPFLLDVFGGFQSARTIHFFTFAALVLFLFGHVAMVFLTGAGRQLRAMMLGR